MEIIPKETPKIPPWLDILFYLSAGLLIFVFISYFLVSQSIKTSQKAMEQIDQELATEVSKSAALKNEILTYQKKIKDFAGVINGHSQTTNIFGVMERQCHPRVWFNDFNLDIKQGKLSLSGEAQNFQALGQQMIIFRSQEEITAASLDAVTIEKGGRIGFEISLSVSPSIFVFK